ncbi:MULTISPECIES: DUF4255 domain-containing protein [Enterobacterales]|nr:MULTISPECIES: DUF4255 domain-containing protein [Enterobacterales]
MINDLNDTLAALLEQELALKEAGINVVFAAPDTRFFQKITPPLIAIFLYDIRENLTLRVSEPFAQQKTAGADTTSLTRSPAPIDYSYLITAWGSSGSEIAPDKDQHDMLSRVLHALLRHPIWPAALLKGQLAAHPLPRAFVAQPGHLHNMAEFWSAMGGHPRAVLHYTVTAPLRAYDPIENIPVVKSVAHQAGNK